MSHVPSPVSALMRNIAPQVLSWLQPPLPRDPIPVEDELSYEWYFIIVIHHWKIDIDRAWIDQSHSLIIIVLQRRNLLVFTRST